MKAILLGMVLTTFSFTAMAEEKRNKDSIVFEPHLSYENGTYEFEDQGDAGTYQTFGVGARGGYNLSFLYIGAEGFFAIPLFESDNNLDLATRETYFIADDSATNLGATLGIRLGKLFLFGTYFYDSKIEGTVKNEDLFSPDGKYKMYGTGARYGVNLRLFAGLTLGVSATTYTYDKYKLNQDVNTLTRTNGKQDRPKLTMTGYMFSLIYNLPIELE